ncbi:MAG TPA: T9SS type A sorting domain-containing protein [Chitinophagaceae bacterium]|jgi:hypothetical protein
MKKIYLGLAVLLAGTGVSAQFQYQLSYLNTSRPGGGGVVSGDILELRAVVSIPSGTSLTKLNYITALPAGTSYVAGSLKVVTNEDVVVPAIANTGNYTDAAGDDQANITGSTISFFMGTGATTTTGGAVTGGTTQPLFQANASIFMAVYKVQVTAATGSTISISGSFHYNTGSNITKNLGPYVIFISPAVSCGTSSLINLFTTETNGTFGSGTTNNRAASSPQVTGFTFVALANSPLGPVDGQYSIVNNSSVTGYSGASPAGSDKLFGVWDVVGDHSGTANGTGNPPAAPGANKGYMLAVNASFAPAVVYTTTIGGLSINTDYTLSFWMRNICPTCGNNPADGTSAGTPGVKPNLAFDINGTNYYSSGDITYTGQWVQKFFTFNTGALTSLTLVIKNNAPGGGGNDWVLDDINITQCLLLLPVSLTRFQGAVQQDGTLLSWQTAEETNTRVFYIERSTDGLQFLTIGQLAAAAIATGSSYYFNDNNPPVKQTLYYRLRIEGYDDAHGYSTIILIKENTDPQVAVYLAPNPAHGSTTLFIKSAVSGTASIRLLNSEGKEVYIQSALVSVGQNMVSVPLPGFIAPGLYLVQTSTGNKTSWSRLIIK